jgi:hypothetical protein
MAQSRWQLVPPNRDRLLLRLRRTMWIGFILVAVGVLGLALPLGFDPDTLDPESQSWFAVALSLTHIAGPVGCGLLLFGSVWLWRLGALQFQLRTIIFVTTVLGLLLSIAIGNVRGVDSSLSWPAILTWLFAPLAACGYLSASIYVNWPCRAV